MGKGWWVGPGAVAGPLRGYVSYHISPEMYEKNGGINLTGFFIDDRGSTHTNKLFSAFGLPHRKVALVSAHSLLHFRSFNLTVAFANVTQLAVAQRNSPPFEASYRCYSAVS